jgi:hypothetical protein
MPRRSARGTGSRPPSRSPPLQIEGENRSRPGDSKQACEKWTLTPEFPVPTPKFPSRRLRLRGQLAGNVNDLQPNSLRNGTGNCFQGAAQNEQNSLLNSLLAGILRAETGFWAREIICLFRPEQFRRLRQMSCVWPDSSLNCGPANGRKDQTGSYVFAGYGDDSAFGSFPNH